MRRWLGLLRGGRGVSRVARFVEKPTREVAEGYLASGKYLWNAGMFFFRAQSMLDAIKEHMPKLAEGIERIEQAAKKGAEAERAETIAVFQALESVSIDYGIMEKVKQLAVTVARREGPLVKEINALCR